MGNLFTTLKNFFKNKNTVTILGVLAGIAVLWFGYSYRVKEATTPIRIPVAAKELSAQTEIKQDDIQYIEINSKFLSKVDAFRNQNEIIGKYVNIGTSIPKGGLFYKAQVVEKSQLPKTLFDNIASGNTLYGLAVNNHTTYGNKIYPGTRIDLFMKATDNNGRVLFGKFIESIEVLAVVDSNGNDVFSSTNPGTPAELLFSVKDEMYELLKKAEYISGISVIPVPRNSEYTSEGSATVTIDDLRAFIESKSGTFN